MRFWSAIGIDIFKSRPSQSPRDSPREPPSRSPVESSQHDRTSGRPRRRFRIPSVRGTGLLLGIMLLVCVIVVIGGARWLAYHDPPIDTTIAIVVDDSDRVLQAAAEFLTADSDRVLWLYSPKPARAARSGAVATTAQRYRSELLRRGADANQLSSISTDAQTSHQWVREIDAAILPHDGDVILFCDSLKGRYWRNVVDQSLPPTSAQRFHLQSVTTPIVHPNRWFQSRYGVKVTLASWLEYLFVRIIGESETMQTARYDELIDKDLIRNEMIDKRSISKEF